VKPITALCCILPGGNAYVDTTITNAQELALLGGNGAEVKRVEIREYKKRSLSANALLHVFVQQVSDHTGHDTEYTKADFKMRFGWPVLQTSQPGRAKYIQYTLDKIGYESFTPKQKLNVWKMFEVTSVMEVTELRQAMENYKNWVLSEFGFELKSNKS
jgi:hypothetical protein